MRFRNIVVAVLTVLIGAGFAGADTKVVQVTHTDGFSFMGQEQPPQDGEQVMWIGDDRLRLDQGGMSLIVDGSADAMLVVNHDDKTVSEITLPLDLSEMMPAGMAEQMMKMMQFDVTIEPNGETRTVGEWKTKGYDVDMTSQMMSMDMTYWAADGVEVDMDTFYTMYDDIVAFQPGMEDLATEMKKIDGFVVAQEGVISMPMMGGKELKTSTTTTSIETVEAPEGTYAPPAGYETTELDYMQMMQNRGK